MNKFYIVRHAQTEWNVEERFQGQLDSPLTKNGRKKIKETAKKLENIEFEKVYTSELGRTIETAEMIIENNKKNNKLKLNKMKELNEIYFGQWQGMTYSEIFEKYPENGHNYFYNTKNYNAKSIKAESLQEGLDRFLKGMLKIVFENEKLNDKNILIVTHGTVIELFLNYILNKENDLDERKLMGNGEFKIFNFKNDKFIEI